MLQHLNWGIVILLVFSLIFLLSASNLRGSASMEQPVDLVEYVHNMLAEGISFKRISEALSISDPRRLKRFMSKALGQKFRVFDNSIVEEVSNKIDALVPIREHGANWGILHVKSALARLSVRPSRRKIARALQILAGTFYLTT